MNYQEFLKTKQQTIEASGFTVLDDQITSYAFPFQRHIIKKAAMMGRYAIFADCGLGKTLMQLEWSRLVSDYTGRNVLILAPLAVVGQTLQESVKFGIHLSEYNEAVMIHQPGRIYITNYEQISNLSDTFIHSLAGVVLDESSILKNFDGKTRNLLIDSFSNTKFKLACTATPSPNDHMELGNHAEFLNVMQRNEMLAMFFVHDGGDTAKWRLKKHAEDEFWKFVSSWAVMINKPSDIGFSDDGYILPDLNFIEHHIKTKKRKNGKLFNDVSVNATSFNQELKITLIRRMEDAAEIVNNSLENFIVWINRNDEADQIKELIPDAEEVRGSEKPELKSKKLLGFANDEFRVLVTKKKIASFGLNYQNCHNQVFASLDFSFEALYQAIRRSYRFGQKHPVNIYLITTDTMGNVKKAIEEKQERFKEMQIKMAEYSGRYSFHQHERSNYMETTIQENNYTLMLGDCVQRIKEIPDNSVHFSIFSPPFSELYVYNDLVHDMGNSRDYEEFKQHFRFLIPELGRVLLPGRNVAVHCMDLPIQKGKEGYIGLRDFSGYLIDLFKDFGFVYHSRVTIWKNPVTEMQRTKALGLLHKQIKKDAVMSRVGIPDYLLIFRNAGDNLIPITHQDKDPMKPDYLPVDLWQKYASPVWMDIDYGNTLNVREGRDGKDEKHICPLQLPTINRSLHLWSNEGETIVDPFGGLMSTGHEAVQMGRKFIGIELKQSYFKAGLKNMRRATAKNAQHDLFSMLQP